MRATPFHEGISAWRSATGLLADGPTSRAFPATRRHQWRFLRLASPITVAGPRRIFTGFPSPPTLNDRDRTAGHGRGLVCGWDRGSRSRCRRAAAIGWDASGRRPRPTKPRRRVRHGGRRIRPQAAELSGRARRARLRARGPGGRRPGARDRMRHRPAHPRPRGPRAARHRGRTRPEPDRAGRTRATRAGRARVRQSSPRGRAHRRLVRRRVLGVGLSLARSGRELGEGGAGAAAGRTVRAHSALRAATPGTSSPTTTR